MDSIAIKHFKGNKRVDKAAKESTNLNDIIQLSMPASNFLN